MASMSLESFTFSFESLSTSPRFFTSFAASEKADMISSTSAFPSEIVLSRSERVLLVIVMEPIADVMVSM